MFNFFIVLLLLLCHVCYCDACKCLRGLGICVWFYPNKLMLMMMITLLPIRGIGGMVSWIIWVAYCEVFIRRNRVLQRKRFRLLLHFFHSMVVCLSVVCHIRSPCPLDGVPGLQGNPQGKGRFWVQPQMQMAAKPSVLRCHLANTNEEFGGPELDGLATAIPFTKRLLWSLFTDFWACHRHGVLIVLVYRPP